MRTGPAILLTLFSTAIPLIADPILTAPGSGAFEYSFRGNTVAEFGATGLLGPGGWDYPETAVFPISAPTKIGESVGLSDGGVWNFAQHFTTCCWSFLVLTPSTLQVPGPGTTTYDSVVSSFYDTGRLVYTGNVPGTASLTITATVPTPEPMTFASTLVGIGVIAALASRRRARVR